jgi:hypothetical protein
MDDSFQWGKLKLLVVDEKIFSFTRSSYDYPTFLVVMNLSDKKTTTNLQINSDIAPRAYVTLYIPGKNNKLIKDTDSLTTVYKINAPVLTKNVLLNPRDCLVLTWYSSN